MSNDGYGGSGGLTMGPIEMKEWNVLKFTELGDALNCMKEYGVKKPRSTRSLRRFLLRLPSKIHTGQDKVR